MLIEEMLERKKKTENNKEENKNLPQSSLRDNKYQYFETQVTHEFG